MTDCTARDALTGNRCILEEGHLPPSSLGEVWDHLGPFPLAWRVIGDVTRGGHPVERHQRHDPAATRFWTLEPEPGVDGHPDNLGPGWVGVVDELAGGVVAWTHEDRADHVIAGLLAAT